MKLGPGGEGKDEAASDMRAMGATESEITEFLGDGDAPAPAFDVWPENWRALMLFLKCRQQFAVGAMGGVMGFRAEGVESVMRMNRVPASDRAALLDDLQAMVGPAAEILNAKRDD